MNERAPRQIGFWFVHRERIWLGLGIVSVLLAIAIAGIVRAVGGEDGVLEASEITSPAVGWSLLALMPLSALAMAATVVGSFMTSIYMKRHDRQDGPLCRWCAREQATTSVTNVEKHRTSLMWWHARLLIVFGEVVFGVAIVVIAAVDLFGDTASWIYPGLVLPFFALGAWHSYVERIHRLLRPWCPYCRGWTDGGVTEPNPDPSGEKVIT